MRAIVKSTPGVGMEFAADVATPEIEPDEVLIDVGAASICGSDFHLYEWSPTIQAVSPTLPLIPGHEVAGTVAQVGSATNRIKVGQRVAVESHIYCGRCYPCRTGNAHLCERMRILGIHQDGGFAEQMKVPESACFPLPDGVSLETGALFEPVGVAVHATQRAGALAGSFVLVAGCGPIGLYVIQLALLAGAGSVLALEIDPFRRTLAEELGAVAVDPRETAVPELCKEMAPRRGGADVAFEATGVRDLLPILFDSMRPDGVVVTIGSPGVVELNISTGINYKYVTLKGVFGRRLWDTWEILLGLVESGRLDLDGIITHRLGLEQFDRSLELLKSGAGKVIIHPN